MNSDFITYAAKIKQLLDSKYLVMLASPKAVSEDLLRDDHDDFYLPALKDRNFSAVEIRDRNLGKICFAVLKTMVFQEETCLLIRDPAGAIDPTLNMIMNDEQGKMSTNSLKNYEEFTNAHEEKLVLMPLNQLLNAYPMCVACKVREWEEIKFNGKFVSITNSGKQSKDKTKLVVSKWYYELELSYSTDVEVILSQEDELEPFAKDYRRYVPVAIAMFSMSGNKEWTFLTSCEFKITRDQSLSVSLPPGNFMIVPLCGTPFFNEENQTRDSETPVFEEEDRKGKLEFSEKFNDTLYEVFKRFDLNSEKCLRYTNIKMILEALDMIMTESEFSEFILKKYEKFKGGLSFNGFKSFMMNSLTNKASDGRFRKVTTSNLQDP